MATDEIIWVKTDHNFCTLKPYSMDILCVYFERGGVGCITRVNGESACGAQSQIALNKVEYLTWKLTK